jgi:hypothetical protein
VEFSCQGDHEVPASAVEAKSERKGKPDKVENYVVREEDRIRDSQGAGIYFTVEVAKKKQVDVAGTSEVATTIAADVVKPLRRSRFTRPTRMTATVANQLRPFTDAEAAQHERLYFSCVAAQKVHILNVQYLPVGAVDTDKTLYRGLGSQKSRLSGNSKKDKNRMRLLLKYLASKGVDDVFANCVVSKSIEKEAAEYARWLEDIHSFVDKSE